MNRGGGREGRGCVCLRSGLKYETQKERGDKKKRKKKQRRRSRIKNKVDPPFSPSAQGGRSDVLMLSGVH